MHSEIQRIQRQVLTLFEQQRDYLRAKPDHYLDDLVHQANESRFAADYSETVAAEINRTAATLLLEQRNVLPASRRQIKP